MNPEDLTNIVHEKGIRLQEIKRLLMEPDVYSRPKEFAGLSRESAALENLLSTYQVWEKTFMDERELTAMLHEEDDPSFKQEISSELEALPELRAETEKKLFPLLIPQDPADSRDIIVEIHPAAGGEEAALFAAEMVRMYQKYAEKRSWKYTLLDQTSSDLGGIKEAVFSLGGSDVFSRMKYESGVHRVQRIPSTEAGGRIHTSTITVAVLPEAEEHDDIGIRSEDLEISTFRSSGPGGQHVNRTDSAVRILHKPSGIVVASQQERSQLRNREIALRILMAKLLEIQRTKEAKKAADSKRIQVGTGDRSERIRTYNFPQNRITDHRFQVSAHNLPGLMEGDLDMILEPLFEAVSRSYLEAVNGSLFLREEQST